MPGMGSGEPRRPRASHRVAKNRSNDSWPQLLLASLGLAHSQPCPAPTFSMMNFSPLRDTMRSSRYRMLRRRSASWSGPHACSTGLPLPRLAPSGTACGRVGRSWRSALAGTQVAGLQTNHSVICSPCRACKGHTGHENRHALPATTPARPAHTSRNASVQPKHLLVQHTAPCTTSPPWTHTNTPAGGTWKRCPSLQPPAPVLPAAAPAPPPPAAAVASAATPAVLLLCPGTLIATQPPPAGTISGLQAAAVAGPSSWVPMPPYWCCGRAVLWARPHPLKVHAHPQEPCMRKAATSGYTLHVMPQPVPS